ncbi:MAG: hypothetical protein JXA04_01425 [Gammaproteobacteria bacterium]|nr:hypothetical protein [Gammaproteobacteria bacterium]
MNNLRLLTLVALILSVSLFRLLPHPPNFTPVLAVALFAGAQFTDRRLAFLVPLLAMLAADLFLGLHATLPFVYGAIALMVLLGVWLNKRITVTYTALTTVTGSLLFFVITNFGAWLVLPELYARSIDGLVAAYIAAIPFYQNALAGDLLFTVVLFGGFFLLGRSFPKLTRQTVS